MSTESVCIIGLGLIGGSLARDLAALGWQVAGFDADPGTNSAALEEGIGTVLPDAALEGALDQDVVVIATPVREVPEVMRRLAEQSGRARLITDVGSTKGSVVAAAGAAGLGPRFVGSHPLAGDHRAGWTASRRGLFVNATVFLCPTEDTNPSAIEQARALWQSVGARPRLLAADEHDTRVAWISHLPQILASALGQALHAQGYESGDLGPGGRDMTRLAASDPRIWTDILLTNRAQLDQPLRRTVADLEALRVALAGHDEAAVLRFLGAGTKLKRQGQE